MEIMNNLFRETTTATLTAVALMIGLCFVAAIVVDWLDHRRLL